MRVRQSALWKRLAAQVLSEESVCHLCGHDIDFNAQPRTRFAPSVDHVVPISKAIDLAFVRENLRAAHYGCNSSKRDGRGQVKQPTSRQW